MVWIPVSPLPVRGTVCVCVSDSSLVSSRWIHPRDPHRAYLAQFHDRQRESTRRSTLLSRAPPSTPLVRRRARSNLAAPPLTCICQPLPNGYPWNTATASNTNPYTNPPYTGVIRQYDFTVARGFIAPDGVNTSVLLVNGQFPGPTLEANWGDTFMITVHNKLTGPAEGTSMHWHGILQKETPWYDGV